MTMSKSSETPTLASTSGFGNRTNSRPPRRYVSCVMSSPVGQLSLIASGEGLAAVLWQNDSPTRVQVRAEREDASHPVLADAVRQLAEYFEGRRTQFSIPLDPTGTPFQHRVWQALNTIPFGETRSYREIAHQIGHPTAVRAVGAANGRNPISIITPCHRVIGSSGRLIGFAGGLDTKAYLLTLEGTGTAVRHHGRPLTRRPAASLLRDTT